MNRQCRSKPQPRHSVLIPRVANHEAFEVARLEFDLKKSQVDYLLDVADRIQAPEIKSVVRDRILNSVDNLTLGDPNEIDARKRLEAPQ